MDDVPTTTNGGVGATENDDISSAATKKNKINTNTKKESQSAAVLGKGKPLLIMMCATLIYYHCLLFRQMNVQVPVDPLEWQISQDTANSMFACLANTVGATESVLRVAATGHDKRLFLKVVVTLYMLSALGRLVSGVTVAYAGVSLFCLYILAENSSLFGTCSPKFSWRRDSPNDVLDTS